jgi:Zn-dependent peptidase ImmA (M78 family)
VPKSRIETSVENEEANTFAALMLMPEPYFSKAMRGVDLLDDQAVGKVARKFQVSLGAVHYRIALAERLIRPIAMRAGRS